MNSSGLFIWRIKSNTLLRNLTILASLTMICVTGCRTTSDPSRAPVPLQPMPPPMASQFPATYDENDPTIDHAIPKLDCDNASPAIFSIGTKSFLTFEPGRVLRIPVEGRDLWCKQTIAGLEVNGTVPVTLDDFYWDACPDERYQNIANIVLTNNYTKLLHSGDEITVQIALSKRNYWSVTNKAGVVTNLVHDDYTAFASRTFTLYESDYYRSNVITHRIPQTDISAFPLPDSEAEYLFGKLVTDAYFVVRLSVRNSLDQDKLINSGMIVASGRAIVSTNPIPGFFDLQSAPTRRQPGKILFTVPVQVSPQSAVHMYTILDDEEPHQPRARFFRGLEFIGALGSAAAASFSGTPDLVKGIALFTGVVIPEGKKLWTDNWPGYKRNIVNFAMPELLKVPHNTVAGHKYIFFPKGDLDDIISDQTLYAIERLTRIDELSTLQLSSRSSRRRTKLVRPTVYIISLGFDNLEIPFENVTSPSEADMLTRVSQISKDLSAQIEARQVLSDEMANTNFYYEPTLTAASLIGLITNVHLLAANTYFATNTNDFTMAMTNLQTIASAFTNQLYNRDLLQGDSGLESLQAKRIVLDTINKDLLAGKDTSASKSMVDQIFSATKNAVDTKLLYDKCAELLKNAELPKAIKTLIKTPGDTNTQKAFTSLVTVPMEYSKDRTNLLTKALATAAAKNNSTVLSPEQRPFEGFVWTNAAIVKFNIVSNVVSFAHPDVPLPTIVYTNKATLTYTNANITFNFFGKDTDSNILAAVTNRSVALYSNHLTLDFSIGIWDKVTNAIANFVLTNTSATNLSMKSIMLLEGPDGGTNASITPLDIQLKRQQALLP